MPIFPSLRPLTDKHNRHIGLAAAAAADWNWSGVVGKGIGRGARIASNGRGRIPDHLRPAGYRKGYALRKCRPFRSVHLRRAPPERRPHPRAIRSPQSNRLDAALERHCPPRLQQHAPCLRRLRDCLVGGRAMAGSSASDSCRLIEDSHAYHEACRIRVTMFIQARCGIWPARWHFSNRSSEGTAVRLLLIEPGHSPPSQFARRPAGGQLHQSDMTTP